MKIEDVESFHNVMKFPPFTDAEDATPEAIRAKRVRLIREESRELTDEVMQGDKAKVLHEGIDNIYVTLGSFVEAGITQAQFEAAWALVHEANMKKIPPNHWLDKAEKPEGWQKPDMQVALQAKTSTQNILVCWLDDIGGIHQSTFVLSGKLTAQAVNRIQATIGTTSVIQNIIRLDS